MVRYVLIISKGVDVMKNMKSGICYMAAGVGMTLLYQSIKDGSLKKMIGNMKNKEMCAIDKLEDMM